jgi:pimeloyl-ACP methyl ester carboxylesterase
VRLLYEQPTDRTFAAFLQHCFPLTTRAEITPEIAARATWNVDVFLHWKRTAPARVDLTGLLGEVRAPTLVLAGEDDPEMTLDGAREVVAALPAGLAELQVFPGARHALFRDAPEAVDALLDFVADERAPA